MTEWRTVGPVSATTRLNRIFDQSADTYGDVTVTEIVEAYAAYCPERHWQPMPVTEVHNKLEGLMLEQFGVTKSHDIKRNDKNQRGFSRVKLRPVGEDPSSSDYDAARQEEFGEV